MFNKNDSIQKNDLALWQVMIGEDFRQEEPIKLILSESYTYTLVMEVLKNKQAECYPAKSHCSYCEYFDIGSLDIEQAKEPFGADYASTKLFSSSQVKNCYAPI
ncbi:hypothetical protein [Marinomonas lutimaris]|jgi:glycine/serine hydroxymethyltransferase|uniref:hypothetical protein n=1 Tax=Marinomonas lutimaris TaxID=2846746 RepID=UPI001CA4DDBA|nr:hypothetical protein [Marinomonas lutimaris]